MRFRSKVHRGSGGSWWEEGIVEHGGHKYAAAGAVVTPTHVVGYPKERGVGRGLLLTSWSGKPLGEGRIVASWPCRGPGGIPCWQGPTIYQMEFIVDGRCYTGRGFGPGMIFRGRLKHGRCKL